MPAGVHVRIMVHMHIRAHVHEHCAPPWRPVMRGRRHTASDVSRGFMSRGKWAWETRSGGAAQGKAERAQGTARIAVLPLSHGEITEPLN